MIGVFLAIVGLCATVALAYAMMAGAGALGRYLGRKVGRW